MTLAATALEIGLTRLCLGSRGSGISSLREGEGGSAAAGASAAASNSHTLAATMAASCRTGRGAVVGSAIAAGARIAIGTAAAGRRKRELEARSLSLLLGLFRRLLGIGEGQRVSTRVSRDPGTAATSAARVYILSALCALRWAKFAEA